MIAECKECEEFVDGDVVGSYIQSVEGSDLSFLYSLLRCPNCTHPMVTLQLNDGSGWEPPTRIYPAEPLINIGSIPVPIAMAYKEARTCLKAKAYTATAIMCRKVLEGITEEHGIKSRNLAGGLREMRDQGIIDSLLFEWADALRVSGNEAAHETGVPISAEDARDILEFTNALMEYVFILRVKFEEWKVRKESRKAENLELASLLSEPDPGPE